MFRPVEEQVRLFREIHRQQPVFTPKLDVHPEKDPQMLLIPEDPLPTVMISKVFEVAQVIADHSSGPLLGADDSDDWHGGQAIHMPDRLTNHWDKDTLILVKAPNGTVAIVKIMLKATLDGGADNPLPPGTMGITFEDHLVAQPT